MGRLLTVIIVAFLIGAVGGLTLLLVHNPAPQHRVETIGTALIGGPFSLINQNGDTVTDQDFRGRYMLVFFGYTNCPDVCPAELQVIAAAMDGLTPKEKKKVVPIFITLDPDRDTPGVLKVYLANFGPEFVGLTGTATQIATVAAEYKVQYHFNRKGENLEDYTIDHSTILYLMGPDGKYLDHFNYGAGSSQIVAALKRYL